MVKTEAEAVYFLKRLSDKLIDLEKPTEINIFEATGMETQEVKHSAFLSWLLNPKASHNQKSLFLSDFVETLYQYQCGIDAAPCSNEQILSKSFSSDGLIDFANASDIEVETEKVIDNPDSRIDIFIYSQSKNTVLVIENKIFTSTHDDQLWRYEKEVEKFNGSSKPKKIFVYLSPFGETPTDINGIYQEGWCIMDYGTVIENLKRRADKIQNEKLKYLIKDYTNMVDNKILHNNPTIRALCKKIRREHKEALEILLNYIDNVDMVYQYIASEWLPRNIIDCTEKICKGRTLVFVTKSISDYYSRCGESIKIDDELFRCQISIGSKDGPVTISLWLAKLKNNEWTSADIKIHDALNAKKSMGDRFCTLYSCTLLNVEEREKVFGDDNELYRLVNERLQMFLKNLRGFEQQLLS